MATIRRSMIIGNVQPDIDDFDAFDELFLFILIFVTFVKTFALAFLLAFLLALAFPLFVEKGIKLFAIGATELTVVVAAFTTEFSAPGTVSVAKSETEFSAETVAFGIVFVAKLPTEFRALGTVLVANIDIEFRAEFAALFVALVRLDTVFIAELSTMLCRKYLSPSTWR
jgi:hypothetical protein